MRPGHSPEGRKLLCDLSVLAAPPCIVYSVGSRGTSFTYCRLLPVSWFEFLVLVGRL